MKYMPVQVLRFLMALCGSWVCTTVVASETATAPVDLGLSTNLVEVTLNLGLVLAAIVLLAWIFKRAQGFNQPAAGQLRVTAMLPLGPKERILVVEVGDEQIVIGASNAGLNTLHVLATPLPVITQDQESFRDKLIKSLRGSSA